ncbi:uncharacterized protein LOC134246186 [Saccostrea cucullata]|uniref:uncharacterized protein LOC134246186 n=1 Tax=Saccostrea cuccullata TaxID=36930 RepID=UPI002ECFB39A
MEESETLREEQGMSSLVTIDEHYFNKELEKAKEELKKQKRECIVVIVQITIVFLIIRHNPGELEIVIEELIYWTTKVAILVLWTCGDVELNPGPLARSQILRKFRRFTQTMLLEMIYKNSGQSMPKHRYSSSPPGWDTYKPEIKFQNISNQTGKEDEVFNKMIWLLQNWCAVPLSSEWRVLLNNYNNLNAKLEEEDSKNELERWVIENKMRKISQGDSTRKRKRCAEKSSTDAGTNVFTAKGKDLVVLNSSYEDKNASTDLLQKQHMSPCPENIDISCDKLDDKQLQRENELDFLDSETYDELTVGLYEPELLIKYLERYLKDLGNSQPSSRMVELCKKILNKKQS